MWSVGDKDMPRVFWGMCMWGKDMVGASLLGLQFYVGLPNDTMDPPPLALSFNFQLALLKKGKKI
jgi:hypothetical protein